MMARCIVNGEVYRIVCSSCLVEVGNHSMNNIKLPRLLKSYCSHWFQLAYNELLIHILILLILHITQNSFFLSDTQLDTMHKYVVTVVNFMRVQDAANMFVCTGWPPQSLV